MRCGQDPNCNVLGALVLSILTACRHIKSSWPPLRLAGTGGGGPTGVTGHHVSAEEAVMSTTAAHAEVLQMSSVGGPAGHMQTQAKCSERSIHQGGRLSNEQHVVQP